MADVFIPEEVTGGFRQILSLSPEKIEAIASFLRVLPISSSINTSLEDLENHMYSGLGIVNAREIVQTILSFSNFFEPGISGTDPAVRLANSFKELYEPDLSENNLEQLTHNLELIFKNSDNLRHSVKALNIASENNNIYKSSKIISDIRLIFNNDINDSNRNAVLLHTIHLNYRADTRNSNFFVTLDLNDLQELKENIERAIQKDEIIKQDYAAIKFV